MSEFTYSCPVCGQHIKCEMSQSGSKMECPTCFQTIIAPDVSPLHDPKFVIQGTKVGGERPVPGVTVVSVTFTPRAPSKKSPLAAVTFVVFFLIVAGAAVYLISGKLFKPVAGQTSRPAPPTGTTVDHVRVPVGWHHYAGPAPDFTLSPDIFARTDFVVTNALAAHLR